MPLLTEADTCRKYVLPKLYASGWSDDHINEQRTFTDGRIVVAGEIIQALEERGITLEELIAASNQPDADPFDLLCQVAYSAPIRTRRERAEKLRKEQKAFFDKYSEKARQVLDDILDKYVDYGTAQFAIPEILKVPPISDRGSVMDISQMFGGADNLRSAINELQARLYAA